MDYKDYLEQGKNKNIHFWYKARLDLLSYLLAISFSENKKREILNIGCGTGTENRKIEKYGHLIALDINERALKKIKSNNSKTVLGDIEKIDLVPNNFAGVCAFDILEHLEEDDLVIRKIYSSLKPGGKFIFTVPAFKFLYGSHDIALEHKRRYNKKEIEEKLKIAGFDLIKSGYWNFILFPLEAIFRLTKKILFKFFKIKKHTTEIKVSNNILNRLLYLIMSKDMTLIKKGINLPFGLTIYGIAVKNKAKT